MPLLRQRPLVFISSAIVGLEDVRLHLHEQIHARDLAEDWVFEIHATAGGEPAEAQYLDIARSCDLMLLIIGQGYSAATEDEYREAFKDNPDKILPFYLRANTDEVRDFRRLIDGRHSRVALNDESELVAQAIEAIERAVRNGRVIMRALRSGFERRLEVLDRLLDVSPPRAYPPALELDGEPLSHSEALERSRQLAVLGIGGSGKTYGALVELHRLGGVRRDPARARAHARGADLDVIIPLYGRASAEADRVEAIVERAFSGVRFYPGPQLTAELAREGRIALVIDGYDDLRSGARGALLRSIDDWAETYPRCRVMVLARALPERTLDGFARAEPAPLDEAQIVELFTAYGQPIRGMIDMPPELKDLTVWPFWANAIARFGRDVSTGLELLQRTVTHRVEAGAPGEPIRQRKLRSALADLALEIHPDVALTQDDALSRLERWHTEPEVAERFDAEPAEGLLEALRGTAILDAEADSVIFVHPLLAGTLAAEAAARRRPVPPAVLDDAELSAFTAALLDDQQAGELTALLLRRDIFFLARVVRLSPEMPRAHELETDLERYESALRALAPLAGPSSAARLATVAVAAAKGETWTALRHIDGDRQIVDDYEQLLALPGADEATAWEGDPFATRLPERVAATEVLWLFKREFDALTASQPHFSPDDRVDLPADQHQLDEQLIARARDLAREEILVRAEAGLQDSQTLPRLDGEPHITVESGPHGRYLREEWAHSETAVEFIDEDGAPGFDQLPRYLSGPAQEEARDRLRRRVEQEIGSALSSGAWNRPTALAGWIW